MPLPLPFGRRRLLAVTGAGVALLAIPRAGWADARQVRLVSPRAGAGVLADYPYWVARKLGYFSDVAAPLDAGATDPTGGAKLVDRNLADLGSPAPVLFAMGLEQGMRLVSVWQIGATDPLSLAFRKGEAASGPRGLTGKTLLLDSAARKLFCDTWFAAAEMEPRDVTYAEAGPNWGQALAQGKGDAALAWDGLPAQWQAQGLAFDYLPARATTHFPGTSLLARASDLADPGRHDLLGRYLRGWAMGMAFAEANPRAAAHIATQAAPELATLLPPPVATAALMSIAAGFRGDMDKRKGWGWHDTDQWAALFAAARQAGQIGLPIKPADVVSNDLIGTANDFPAAQVKSDAAGYVLPPDFAQVDVAALGAQF